MPELRVVESLEEIDRSSWDACFPNEIESYDYLLAVERAELGGFRWAYAIALADGKILAAAPGFLTEYALDTTLTGAGKKIVTALRRVAPGALTLRLGCIGSPCTETAGAGFHPDVASSDRSALLGNLLSVFETYAKSRHCGLLAVKDAASGDNAPWDVALRKLGYRPAPGMPSAYLDIDFDSMDAYFARLSKATRKDMRRKIKGAENVRIEIRDKLDDVLDRVVELYRATFARADLQFEELTPAYFSGVLELMPGRAFCVLYFVDDALLAANLLIQSKTTLLDKFFCMDGEAGRLHNLYFLSWFTNVRLCLERNLVKYQSGQAAYENKIRLGSRLIPTSMYFRHRNALISGAMHLVAPLFFTDPAFTAATP